ncbi:hypothetical protein AMTRI_Chr13g121540 [Amborella trichopoda]
MDFVKGLPVYKGKSVVLVVIDMSSKYAHFIPLSHPHTATGVAQIFFNQVFKLHGMLRTIAEYCYNTSWHSAIKTTPFEVVYGRPPPSLLKYFLDRDLMIKELRVTLKEAQTRMKKVYDSHHQEREFSTLALRKTLKLSPRYYVPYMIVKKIEAVVYKLDLPKESRIHPMFHVSLRKKRVGEGIPIQSELPIVQEDDDILHPQPQAVLDQRVNKRKKQILIHWQEMSPTEAT